MFAITSAFSWQKSVRYCSGSFVPQGQTCRLLEISLDFLLLHLTLGFPDSSVGKESGKESPTMWETWVQFLHWEDPLEKGKATHSSILAWRTPWTTKLQRVGQY